MAIRELADYLAAGKAALDLFKGIRDELPPRERTQQLQEQIEKAEEAFQRSQAELAKELGYHLCRCTWPPQIMLWNQERGRNVCGRCGDVFPHDRPEPQRTGGRLTGARRGR